MITLRDKESKDDTPWFSIIQGFYIEAQLAFFSAWRDSTKKVISSESLCGPPPELWKTVGDEILFTKVLTDYRQLSLALECWISALGKIRSFLKRNDNRLDVKATAWIAGFPVKNKDVVSVKSGSLLSADPQDYFVESGIILNEYYTDPGASKASIDFVGPSVDVGFRLASHASARRFVVSVGIPYILSLTTPDDDALDQEIKFHFGGAIPLKGVFGGLPYPLFWIDMGESGTAATLEDRLTGDKPCDPRDVQKYCAAFYREQTSYTFRPFILEDGEHKLTIVPDWYVEKLDKLIENFLNPPTLITEGEDPEEPAFEGKIVAAVEIAAALNLTTSPPDEETK
ncbi:hypothetical protein [Sphingomonas sp. BK235]|uniref:hypothetical protein n=1 Tax=Sphingomonas sp. BK235 TaxID=2512131 RepID=UPI00104978FB|nr:hypothetical protein [Sphingomonas sp. BK235]